MDIIPEMEAKLNALSLPRGFSVQTVLIHVNGITEALEDAQYFSAVVDFSDLLQK